MCDVSQKLTGDATKKADHSKHKGVWIWTTTLQHNALGDIKTLNYTMLQS